MCQNNHLRLYNCTAYKAYCIMKLVNSIFPAQECKMLHKEMYDCCMQLYTGNVSYAKVHLMPALKGSHFRIAFQYRISAVFLLKGSALSRKTCYPKVLTFKCFSEWLSTHYYFSFIRKAWLIVMFYCRLIFWMLLQESAYDSDWVA